MTQPVVEEKWNSGDLEDDSGTILALVFNCTDRAAAYLAVYAWAPEFMLARVGQLFRGRIKVEVLTPSVFTATIDYGTKPPTGDREWSFDTTGGSQKITQALDTVAYAPEGETAPDFGDAINVTKDDVEGVEIYLPKSELTEKCPMSASAVTMAYYRTLVGLTGKINDQPFRGFAKGEVLFLGTTGQKKNNDLWDVTFKFSTSPNVTGIVVAGIDVDEKGGWDYLWCYYEQHEDEAAKRCVKRAVAAYVATVYESGDFSLLNIGTGATMA